MKAIFEILEGFFAIIGFVISFVTILLIGDTYIGQIKTRRKDLNWYKNRVDILERQLSSKPSKS